MSKNFPLYNRNTTRSILEYCGQGHLEDLPVQKIGCCRCLKPGKTYFFSGHNPQIAWFYCNLCKFAGDVLDYLIEYQQILAHDREKYVQSKLPSWRPDNPAVIAYHHNRETRINGEKFWTNVATAFRYIDADPAAAAMETVLPLRKRAWEEVFNQQLYAYEKIKVAAEIGETGHRVREHISRKAKRTKTVSPLIMRMCSRPGELQGFLYMHADEEINWWFRGLRPGTAYGMGLLETLYDETAYKHPFKSRFMFLDPLPALQLSGRYAVETGVIPPIAIMPIKATTGDISMREKILADCLSHFENITLWSRDTALAKKLGELHKTQYSLYDKDIYIADKRLIRSGLLLCNVENYKRRKYVIQDQTRVPAMRYERTKFDHLDVLRKFAINKPTVQL